MTDNHGVRRVAIAILHYFRDHPRAKDSAKGIAQYWVGEDREIVEKALAFLRQEGMIQKRRHLYQLAQISPAVDESQVMEKMLRRLRKQT